jgi:hypothetical protein
MADELLEKLRDLWDGPIVSRVPRTPSMLSLVLTIVLQDFEGQKLAELLTTVLLSVVGVSRRAWPCP